MPDLSTEQPAAGSACPATAWQPLTFGGVAAFAHASWSRLWLVELIMALLVAGSSIWFLNTAWGPAIQQAIHQLPDQGEIRRAQLQWEGAALTRLASTPFLAVSVDLEEAEDYGPVADLLCTFGKTGIVLKSLLGSLRIRYPADWVLAFNRTELEPWWGAWKPVILAGMGIFFIVCHFICWTLLALLYTPAVRLIAWLLNRQATGLGSWRLATAALMPGAVLMSASLIGYGLRHLHPLGLMMAFGLHWFVGWAYLLLSPAWLPSKSRPAGFANPFVGSGAVRRDELS